MALDSSPPPTGRPRIARIVSDAPLAALRRPLLGMPLGLRAVYAALDAGATGVTLEGTAQGLADLLRARGLAQAEMAPLGVPTLVVTADALVSVELLRRLAPGEVITDDDGHPLAGLVTAAPGDAALAALGRGRAHPFEPGELLYALRPTSPPDRRAARRLLLKGLIKPQDGPASRLLNRPVSTRVTAAIVPLGVTPTMMTVVVALFGVAGGLFAAGDTWALQVLGALLYQAHSILDGCDGEIARLTKNFSKHGALLDSVVDDLSNLLFFVGLSVGVHRSLGADWPLFFGAATAAGYLGVTVVQFNTVLRATGKGFKATFWDSAKPRPLWYRVLHASLRRDVFIWICLALVVVGAAPALVAVMPFAAAGTLVATVKRARG